MASSPYGGAVRVAMAQMDCRPRSVAANVQQAEEMRAQAEADGAELVVFPELTLTGYSSSPLAADVAMASDDERLARVAGDGSVIVGFVEGPRYNAAAWWAEGRLRHVQRKLYLPTYGPWQEGYHFTAGDRLDVVGGVAILICNDAWHPALVELAVRRGAEVLVVPTNSTRRELIDNPSTWRAITRAYARLFQVFVVFVNRVGLDGGFSFWGGSHVVDFDGQVLAEAPEDVEAVVLADLDLGALRHRRKELPLLDDPRLELLAAGFTSLAHPDPPT